MTRISVSTRALSDGGRRVQGFGRQSGERADAVRSVLTHLDMEFKGRSRYDEIVRATSNDLSVQAQRLQQHAAYLVAAAAKYEQAEERVLGSSREFDGRYHERATGPNIASAFKGLWRQLKDGLESVDVALLKEAWTGSRSALIHSLKGADALLQSLVELRQVTVGTAVWAWQLHQALKVVGVITSAVGGAIDGVLEFRVSAGSMARRVSNGVVVGAASFVGSWGERLQARQLGHSSAEPSAPYSRDPVRRLAWWLEGPLEVSPEGGLVRRWPRPQ